MFDIARIFDLVSGVADGSAPWWVFAVILLVPFSILMTIREAYCWFNKVNAVISRLDRLDTRMKELSNSISQLASSISTSGNAINLEHSPTKNGAIKSEATPSITPIDDSQNNEEFYLDKDWTNK